MKTMTMRDRVKAALAEAGYPDAEVRGREDDPSIGLNGPHGVPAIVCWRAFFVAGGMYVCWPCWEAEVGEAGCDHEVVFA